MYKKVKEFIRENHMIEEGDFILAGVSGGADSMAMLAVLEKLREEIRFQLKVVHVHHGIRGAEADRDCSHVEDICKNMGIPCKIYYYDVPGLAGKWKLGLEETGRIVRKKAFDIEINALGGNGVRIALAHNQDDLAETMLHHLARGSGIRGLASMRPVSGRVIRPVLCIRRKEIEQYLNKYKISYVTDSTNLSDCYTRNKIRHKILPLLEQDVNPQASSHMAETSKMLALAEDYFTRKAMQLLEVYRRGDEGFFFGDSFFSEEEILVRYVFIEAFRNISGKCKDFQAAHVKAAISLYKRQVGSRCSLPYGIEAVREYKGVWLGKKEKMQSSVVDFSGEKWEILIEGVTKCPLGTFRTKIFLYRNQKIPEKKYTKWMDYDKIKGNLYVRTRRQGDILALGKDGSHKKLNRYMIDEKIPKCIRASVPLLVYGEDILWVVGGRISESYKITPDTKYILEVEYQGGNWNE